METPSVDPPSDEPIPEEVMLRDAAHWAKPTSRLKVQDLPPGAINLNLEGRQLTNPMHGFGQLWRKTYRVRLSGVSIVFSDDEAFTVMTPEGFPISGWITFSMSPSAPSFTGWRPRCAGWQDSFVPEPIHK